MNFQMATNSERECDLKKKDFMQTFFKSKSYIPKFNQVFIILSLHFLFHFSAGNISAFVNHKPPPYHLDCFSNHGFAQYDTHHIT